MNRVPATAATIAQSIQPHLRQFLFLSLALLLTLVAGQLYHAWQDSAHQQRVSQQAEQLASWHAARGAQLLRTHDTDIAHSAAPLITTDEPAPRVERWVF